MIKNAMETIRSRLLFKHQFYSMENFGVRVAHGRKPPWGWDYAFIFDIEQAHGGGSAKQDAEIYIDSLPEKGGGFSRVSILARLKSAGFVFSQIISEEENVILVRFTLPEAEMKRKAERLPLDAQLQEIYGGGHMEYMGEYSQCFVNVDRERVTGSYFSPSDRIMIILRTLQSRENWGCGINVEKLVHEGVLKQAFAIHSPRVRDELVRRAVWNRWWDPRWRPPFRGIKDYLGARVGFYFAFVSLYARYLFPLALLGLAVFVVHVAAPRAIRTHDALSWLFAITVVLWATFFLEALKRRSAELVHEWGMQDRSEYVDDETSAQFTGEMRYGFYSAGGFVPLSDLTGRPWPEIHHEFASEHPYSHRDSNGFNPTGALHLEQIPINVYVDSKAMRHARLFSLVVTAVFIAVVASLTFFLLWFRNDIICLAQRFSKEQCDCYFSISCTGKAKQELTTNISGVANALPGILNGILIAVFDFLWTIVSKNLTLKENNRTNQEFENSYVYKYFIFQFFSNCEYHETSF